MLGTSWPRTAPSKHLCGLPNAQGQCRTSKTPDITASLVQIRLDMAESFEVSGGEQGKDFVMHKHIAIRHSSFLKAALSYDWKFLEKRIALRD